MPVELALEKEVEAKYGKDWHAAAVIEVTESGAKIKWGYDSSESEVSIEDLREKLDAEVAERLTQAEESKEWIIVGLLNARKAVQLRIACIAEETQPGTCDTCVGK